nr:uncharacterized protein LOC111419365 [Onthophagus taurus]XP_022907927.1 uncharacterized protein LOC111419365 [Onthophagus taurus]
MHTSWERIMYTRDRRIDPDTNPYIVHGLDNIPEKCDEDEQTEQEDHVDEMGEFEVEEEASQERQTCDEDKEKPPEPCKKTPKERDYSKEYALEDDDLCRK